jgi:hypothetical protein
MTLKCSSKKKWSSRRFDDQTMNPAVTNRCLLYVRFQSFFLCKLVSPETPNLSVKILELSFDILTERNINGDIAEVRCTHIRVLVSEVFFYIDSNGLIFHF